MLFHARLDYGTTSHYFYNNSENTLVEEVVIPFVSGQVVILQKKTGPMIFNMKSATFLQIYSTKTKLAATEDRSIVDQFKDAGFQKNDCTREILGKVKGRNSAKSLSSLIQKALQPPKPQIFVVMKFGDEILDSAYAGAYRTVAAEFGLECVRIDEIHDSGKISDQILDQLAESKYVLCDLTGARPNCYYETGFAHALGKDLILLAHKKEKVHFDLQGHRFIQWSTEEELRRKLRERLVSLEASRNRDE